MRHSRKAPDISDILPSIREKGIRQTLIVRREGDGYGVIAGRRRYFALRQIAAETGADPQVPCAVMPEDDAASAIEASLIEVAWAILETEGKISFIRRKDPEQSVAANSTAALP